MPSSYSNLAGRKPDYDSDVSPSLALCLEKLETNNSAHHGKVRISYRRFQPDEFAFAYLAARQSGRFRCYFRPRPDMRTWIAVSFAEKWKIGVNVQKHLRNGFCKFTSTRPAVIWLRFSDMIPPEFRPDDPVGGDAVLDHPDVRQVLRRYLSKDKFNYPTGIIISPDLSCLEISQGHFRLPVETQFLPSHGLSFDNRSLLQP